ncbi:MAG: M13 family metallopeptidase [Treponema sp.]|jgi:putative endopeptidase|nr:M13 family metallopeptidase [Treponema sp.]
MTVQRSGNFFGRILALSVLVLFCACAATARGGKGSSSGLESNVFDRSVSPGADFYGYVNNNWLETNPLPADKTRITTFSVLQDENNRRLKAILEGIDRKTASPGSDEAKLALLYDMYLDSEKRNRDGMLPVTEPLKNITELREKAQLAGAAADLRKQGVEVFFSSGIDVDQRDSTRYIFTFWQSGISMYEGFYLGSDERSAYLRDELEKHMGNIFTLAGFSAAEAQRKAHAVFTIEKQLAAVFYDNVKLRDPQASYNKMRVAELSALCPAIDWQAFLDIFGVSGPEEVMVGQPEFLAELNRIITAEPLENLKAYMQWRLLSTAAPFLSDDFYREDFRFYGTILQGQQESEDPWQRALGVIRSFMGEALSRLFVEKYFSPEAKERVTVMVENIRDAFSERIARLEWMGGGTKERAQEKLRNTKLKIGYPEKWEDYTALELQDDSLFANIRRGVSFSIARRIEDMKKPVDRSEWSALPVTVNAYYEWSNNDIIFPAAILQPPFFDMAADDAYNYGAIGVVIGHELSHGFDDEGRQFDKDGNLRDWWEAEDAERFNTRAQVLVDFFNAVELAPDLYANGALTLGENIGDNGGLHTAFAAFQKTRQKPPLAAKNGLSKGLSPEQRFFIAYTILWQDKMNDEALVNFTLTNEHAIGRWRVNAALPHIDEWYTAFGIQSGDPLYVAPEKRASIW